MSYFFQRTSGVLGYQWYAFCFGFSAFGILILVELYDFLFYTILGTTSTVHKSLELSSTKSTTLTKWLSHITYFPR